MTTPSEYRQFAIDCLDWARHVSSPSNRALLVGHAIQWLKTAAEMEAHCILSRNPGALEKELRTKLD